MTQISKSRLEALSDGIIAIIMTIMVLELPYPKSYSYEQIKNFCLSLFVFLDSFLIVGIYWHKHCVLTKNIQEVTNKIVWKNLLFLFTISLFPLFTKWVIADFGQIVPVIGYLILYLLSEQCLNIYIKSLFDNYSKEKTTKDYIINFFKGILILLLIVVFVYYLPYVASIFLLAFPLIHSLCLLWIENRAPR